MPNRDPSRKLCSSCRCPRTSLKDAYCRTCRAAYWQGYREIRKIKHAHKLGR